MTHLSQAEINAYVQYENNNNEFFSFTEGDYTEIQKHLNSCVYCKKHYDRSQKVYGEIEALPEVKKNPYWIYSAAALILIALYPFLMQSELNKDAFIKYSEFGFTIHRGSEGLTTELQNELTFLLNEKKYNEAIALCEKKQLTKNNLHYFAALVMRGQENDNKNDIKKAINTLTNDSLKTWHTKGKQLLKE